MLAKVATQCIDEWSDDKENEGASLDGLDDDDV